MRNRYGFFDFGLIFLARGAAEVINDKVPGHAANESGEPLRLSNISPSNLFKDDAEAFLVDVLSGHRVTDYPANDDHYAKAITLDKFSLRLPVAFSNAAH
jgi:hypothetical protein